MNDTLDNFGLYFKDENLVKIRKNLIEIKFILKVLIDNGKGAVIRINENGACFLRKFGMADLQIYKINSEDVDVNKQILFNIIAVESPCVLNKVFSQNAIISKGEGFKSDKPPFNEESKCMEYIIDSDAVVYVQSIPETQSIDLIVKDFV